MKKLTFRLILFVILSSFPAGPLFALETGSFTSRLGLGFMSMYKSNNLDPKGSEKRIDSLNSEADMEFSFLPVLVPSVTWDIGEPQGVKFFFDTKSPIDEVGNFAFDIGASYLSESTIYEFSTFFSPFEEVYKNPYLTGVDRATSDTSQYGISLSARKIFGTGLDLHLIYLSKDVDEDEIGALIPDMARDGAVYSAAADYSVHLSKSFALHPQISLTQGEFDGDSNSFTKIKAKLKGTYMHGRMMLSPEVSYSHSEYDEMDRIFNKNRKNDSFGINLLANYMAPFDLQDWSLICLAGYNRGESNIDFYDTKALNFGLFFSYHF